MFYKKCPYCGGKVESAEDDAGFGAMSRGASHWLRTASAAGHSHPFLKAMTLTIGAGREVYKRVPGGGLKRCENGHEFR